MLLKLLILFVPLEVRDIFYNVYFLLVRLSQ